MTTPDELDASMSRLEDAVEDLKHAHRAGDYERGGRTIVRINALLDQHERHEDDRFAAVLDDRAASGIDDGGAA